MKNPLTDEIEKEIDDMVDRLLKERDERIKNGFVPAEIRPQGECFESVTKPKLKLSVPKNK